MIRGPRSRIEKEERCKIKISPAGKQINNIYIYIYRLICFAGKREIEQQSSPSNSKKVNSLYKLSISLPLSKTNRPDSRSTKSVINRQLNALNITITQKLQQKKKKLTDRERDLYLYHFFPYVRFNFQHVVPEKKNPYQNPPPLSLAVKHFPPPERGHSFSDLHKATGDVNISLCLSCRKVDNKER